MAATSTFLQSASNEADASTYTYSSQNLGTASADRYIVVGITGRKSGASTTISSVTVGGVSATIVSQVSNFVTNSAVTGLAIALVPSGTTGDVVVVFGATLVRSAIGLWAITGLTNPIPTTTATSVANDGTCTINVLEGGFVIGVGVSLTATAWTGITERYDFALSTMNSSGASDNFASAQTGLTITADRNTTTEPATVFAAWGDSPGSSKFFQFFNF